MAAMVGAFFFGLLLWLIGSIGERRAEEERERRFRERWEHYERTGEFIPIDRWPG